MILKNVCFYNEVFEKKLLISELKTVKLRK